jgi:hypothetical protein
MAVLECVKPGAKLGQIILAVDLTVAGSGNHVLPTIERLGYEPEIRHVNYASGIHVLAILKDEQHEQAVDDDYLLEEWLQVRSQINADAVHLWRGK